MTDFEKAQQLFHESGLTIPTIPQELANKLKERRAWLFSTRDIEISPYDLQHYIREAEGTQVVDYVILAHSGHGANSYAIQYYLVHKTLRLFLRLFLHLAWGGIYMDAGAATSRVRNCLLLADELVSAAQSNNTILGGDRLTVVGSDFYGSYWSGPRDKPTIGNSDSRDPSEILKRALYWLRGSDRVN